MSPTQTTRRPWKSTFWSRWTNSLPLPYTSVPHAHIYIRKLFPKKAFTRSQEVRFPMVFIRKRCEGFHFQPFTRFTGHGVTWGRVWRLGRQCEGLKSPTLHNGKQWTSAGNEQSVNGWTVFSRINYVYIYTREGKKQWNFHGHSKTDTMTSLQPQPHPSPPNHVPTLPSRSHTAVGYTAPWLCMNKSRTIFHYSAIRKNKSWTCETKPKAWKK